MNYEDCMGRIVYSKSGRDMERNFIIVGIINDEYVYISDGDLRKIEKPKKKKVKHLIFTDKQADEIRKLILAGNKVSNLKIKKFLKSEDIDKEV